MNDAAFVFIYALLDPSSNEIRYIGKSNNPKKRLTRHLKDAERETNHRARWLRALKNDSLLPRIEVIAEVPVEEWEFWERHYIADFRRCGFDLTNATLGGDGYASGPEHPYFGRPHSPAHKEKIRKALVGKKHTPERRENIRRAHLGIRLSPESVIKRVAAFKNTWAKRRAQLSCAQT